MLITNAIFKNCNIAERGLYSICSKLERNLKLRNFPSFSSCSNVKRTLNEKCLMRRMCAIRKFPSYEYRSVQSAAFSKKGNNVQIQSSFQEMIHSRKAEAHRSILIEVVEKADIPFAIAYFEKYGCIANMFFHPGESKNCFLLLEFSSEDSIQKLLLNCGFHNIDDVYPVCSRILHYEKKSNNTSGNVNMNVIEDSCSALSFKTEINMSEVIENIFSNEKLTELDTRLRFFLCSLMKDSLSGLFPQCDVVPFGSSVNGVGKRGCDLDIVIRLYPEKLNGDGEVYFVNKTCVGKQKNLQQKALFRLGEFLLFSPGVSLCNRVMFARVPILKMKHTILNMDFDVSVNNMSAVVMSDMLHFCGEIDSRVRPLVHVVKKWAKESNVTKADAGYQISNFGLTTLVLFFLQTKEPHPILPPLNDAFIIQGSDDSYDFGLQYLKSVEDWKKYASLNKEPLAVLLKDFLVFLSSYPFHQKIVSLLSGETRTRDENSMPLYIEYPLDEALNVTKNVSKAEYDTMCEKAKISAKFVENNLKRTVKSEKDFSALLGIPSVSRIGLKSDKFNVRSVLENDKNSRNRNMKFKAT